MAEYSIYYHEDVVRKDIAKLSSTWKKKIKHAIEKKLITYPELFGVPLRRSLKGYRKLRVGDYRVIFLIRGNTVRIMMIEHRSRVYGEAGKRIEL